MRTFDPESLQWKEVPEPGASISGRRLATWFAIAIAAPPVFMVAASFVHFPLWGWTWPTIVTFFVMAMGYQRRQEARKARGDVVDPDDPVPMLVGSTILWFVTLAWIVLRLGYENNWKVDLREVALAAVGGPIAVAVGLALSWLMPLLWILLYTWPAFVGYVIVGLIGSVAWRVFAMSVTVVFTIGWITFLLLR